MALDFAFFDDTILFCFDELLDDLPLLLQFDTMLKVLCEATLLDNTFRSFAKEKNVNKSSLTFQEHVVYLSSL